MKSRQGASRLIFGLILLLAILHQDFWWWNDTNPMVWGFLPIGLAYHAAVSIAAAILWALAVRYCWPLEADELESDWAGSTDPGAGGHQQA